MTAEPTPALDLDAVERVVDGMGMDASLSSVGRPFTEYVLALLPAARRTLERVRECPTCGGGGVEVAVFDGGTGPPARSERPCYDCAPDREALRSIVAP